MTNSDSKLSDWIQDDSFVLLNEHPYKLQDLSDSVCVFVCVLFIPLRRRCWVIGLALSWASFLQGEELGEVDRFHYQVVSPFVIHQTEVYMASSWHPVIHRGWVWPVLGLLLLYGPKTANYGRKRAKTFSVQRPLSSLYWENMVE